jgi:AraC-like DNA-binding protein
MPKLRDRAPAASRRTPRALRRPVSAVVLASDEGWQRLIDRVGDHVLLTRLTSLDWQLDANDQAADVLILEYGVPTSAGTLDRWMCDLAAALHAHGTPLVVYAPLQATIARALGDWTALGITGVVFREVDDEDGAAFAKLLQESSARSVGREIARALLSADAPWPATSRAAIGKLFFAPAAYRSVDDLARGAGVTRRSLERWAAQAGLVSVRRLLVVARLAWIYGVMQRGPARVQDVAIGAGFTSASHLRASLRAIAGVRDLAEFGTLSRRRVRLTLSETLRSTARAARIGG